jgi:hypothetical protein
VGERRGRTEEANEPAKRMRRWLGDSRLRVRAFHARLKPEHFTDGRIPSGDTV